MIYKETRQNINGDSQSEVESLAKLIWFNQSGGKGLVCYKSNKGAKVIMGCTWYGYLVTL